MFDYNQMIKRAVQFFPTWSNIRKKYDTSNGGKLLNSITEEIVDLQCALEEYKKYYFLDTYKGHENEVVAFSYMANIGIVKNVEDLKIVYNNKELELTQNINEFFENMNLTYYENGKIYIRDKYYNGVNVIKVFINETYVNFELTKVHVWNIYDEFACFVNLQRHENETNEELIKRILHNNRYKGNATINGLRNAIVTELMTEFPELADPNIAEKDIQISRINDDNLREAYKGFSTLLDYLNSLNRDVYRWKRWDLDEWQYNFKSIEYIPAQWDAVLTKWQNGIGHGDHLNVTMAGNAESTNATLTLYDKSKDQMYKYLSDKNLVQDIPMTFKRCNDILNNAQVNYTIKASPMVRLQPEKIKMNIFENNSKKEEIAINEIYKLGKDIQSIDGNNKITDMYPYRVKFTPKDKNVDLQVERCTLLYINKVTGAIENSESLLTEKNGFTINALGTLSNTTIKQSITKIENFNANSVIGMTNTNQGIKCSNINAQGIKTLYNLGGKKVTTITECEMSEILSNSGLINLDSTQAKWSNNKIIFNPDYNPKRLEIKITANKFSFDVLSDNELDVMMRYGTSGKYTTSKAIKGTTWSTEESNEPRYMEIIINAGNVYSEVVIGKLLYSKYSIKTYYKTKTNWIEFKTAALPLSNVIDFKIEVKSESSGCPIIKGIHIGNESTDYSYTTKSFDVRTNCYRMLDIKCNCNVTLIKRDLYDTVDTEYAENYSTIPYFKASSNNSYIRLNLDDYQEIDNIFCSVGQIEMIEESGRQYYNLKLYEGDIASTITVTGTKLENKYSITLLEMLNRALANLPTVDGTKLTYNLERDRVYCSRLTDGVILLKNNESAQTYNIKLSNKLLYNFDAIKYEIVNLPDDIGVKWGVSQGIYSNSISGSFDYIAFYPANSKIHVANNTYNLYTPIMKDIPIVENFTDIEYYNPKALNFYTIETNSENAAIRFYNYIDEFKEFDELEKWSVGLKNLYIKTIQKLNNEEIYNIRTIDYIENCTLSESIEIKDTYEISNNNTIVTEQYMLEVPDGITIKYQEYDGTSETSNLLKTEAINVENRPFKKLIYSNIDRIIYIGTVPYQKHLNSDIKDYTLLNKEGIIIWPASLNTDIVYIAYTIKKPVNLIFDLDMLYKLTGYVVETYKELSSYRLIHMKDNDVYDISKFNDYKNSNLVYIECDEPTFEGQMINDHIVKFNKYIQEKTIMVKTGYYYINGREYYLFSEEGELGLENNKNLICENVDVSDDNIYTYKPANNYVKNSEMLSRGINKLYNFDCTKADKKLKFNKYTACESYNGWITFNTNLKLTDKYYKYRLENTDEFEGFNNVCLELDAKDKNMINYALLDITDLVKVINVVSIAATKELKIYIGKDIDLGTYDLKRSLNIEPIIEIKNMSNALSSIRTTEFSANLNSKYYLIVMGTGAIDDIIISDSLENTANYHVKNIEKFNFNFIESRHEGSRYRMALENNINCISKNASICSDNKIRIIGDVDWNITSVKKYETRDDFNSKGCYKDTELIVGDYLKTPKNSTGRFITDYLIIDPQIVKRLFFKINDININHMNDIKVTILTTDDKTISDLEVITIKNNCGFVFGEELMKYVKLKIEIPEDTIVSNIEFLIEYKQNDRKAPAIVLPDHGELISPVYDVQEALNYHIGSININSISNTNDVKVYIRALEESNISGVWFDWNEIPFDKYKDKTYNFENKNCRFFQFKVVLNSKDAYIDLDSLEIEVK